MGLLTSSLLALQAIATPALTATPLYSQVLGPEPGLATTVQLQSQLPGGTETCQSRQQSSKFLVVAGGPEPESNEIALEKNVLYFQRTMKALGLNPTAASIYFANGTDGKATIRFINEQGRQQFKVPQIPNLNGPATPGNIQRWFQQVSRSSDPGRNIFFYFTGHGALNRDNADNNGMMLWGNTRMTVQEFATLLDQVPQDTPVVTMMAQCFSGSFANFIHEGGDPKRPVALQSRCGFFATIKTLPSVGCTPMVNEADYRDYSSSFFAGLSGRSRTGQPVASADYDRDGKVTYAEAHAFAKVDEYTTDLPISTSEAWLQRQFERQDRQAIFNQPINQVLKTARPDQRYVVTSLVKMFSLNPQTSFAKNAQSLNEKKVNTEEKQAYLVRLMTELVNVGLEKKLRAGSDRQAIATLNRIQACERTTWSKP